MATQKKAWLSAVASIIMIGVFGLFFAFKPGDTKTVQGKKVLQYFYRYTSSSTSQTDIQNIANYQRSNLSCESGEHLCGVYLNTDKPLGQQPLPSEFNAVKTNLWTSEQAGNPALPNISMKN